MSKIESLIVATFSNIWSSPDLVKTKTIILLFLFALAAQLRAQDFRPGYIIKAGNDTIRGLISYRSGKTIADCDFKASKKAPVQKFTAEEIIGYDVDFALYEMVLIDSDTMPKGRVFMRVLARGYYDLYRYREFFFLKRDELIGLPEPLLIRTRRQGPEDDRVYMKRDSRFVVLLNQLVQDCGFNANASGYNADDILALVTAYNECKGEVRTLPAKDGFKINFQLFAGYGPSKMVYDYAGVHIPYNTCRTVSGGGGVDLSSPALFDRLFFTAEIWYSKPFYQGYYEGQYSGTLLREDFLLDVTYLRIPIGFRFNFMGGANTPYMKTGLSFSRLPNYNFRTIDEAELPDGTIYSEGVDDDSYFVKTNTRRLWMGIGYSAQVNRIQLFAELRAETGDGFIGDAVDSKSKITEFNILGGIRF